VMLLQCVDPHDKLAWNLHRHNHLLQQHPQQSQHQDSC